MRSILILLAALVLLPTLAFADGGRLVKGPAAGSPEAAVMKFLEAGVANDFEAFYTSLCHPDFCHQLPKDRADKEHYMWARFVKFAPSYFKDGGKTSFEVTRMVPESVDASTSEVKLFLSSSKRDNPTPVVVKKDDKGAWKIVNTSL